MSQDREKSMVFPDRRGGPQRTIGKHVYFSPLSEEGRWMSTPLKIYVAGKAMEARR